MDSQTQLNRRRFMGAAASAVAGTALVSVAPAVVAGAPSETFESWLLKNLEPAAAVRAAWNLCAFTNEYDPKYISLEHASGMLRLCKWYLNPGSTDEENAKGCVERYISLAKCKFQFASGDTCHYEMNGKRWFISFDKNGLGLNGIMP